MKLSTMRFLDAKLGVPLCHLCSWFQPLLLRKKRKGTPQRILLILISEMGSLVQTEPMVHHLKSEYPQAELYALMFAKNREFLEVLNWLPRENILTLRDGNFLDFVSDSLKVIRRMRELEIDVIFDLELFSRVSALFSTLSGAPERIGFESYQQEGLDRARLLSRELLYNPYLHISQQFLNLARSINATETPAGKNAIEETSAPEVIELAEEVKRDFRGKLLNRHPDILNGRLVLLYPSGGALPLRAWPPEYYAELADDLLLDPQIRLGIIGKGQDQTAAAEVFSLMKTSDRARCFNLVDVTASVMELMVLLDLSALLITNDGGPAHFSAKLHKPTLVFFGPETPVIYGTLNPKAHHLFAGLACSPCLSAYNHRNSSCDGDNRCLKQIEVAQALAKAREMLLPN